MAQQMIALVAAIGTICAMAYHALTLVSACVFLRDSRWHHEFKPPVSILKPLRGIDPDIYESFRSHCRQDYPEFEIIFGVRSADDSAVPLVQKLQLEFPERPIRLVICSESLGKNAKVNSLIQMLGVARNRYFVVNDSDIAVPSDYLRRIMQPFGSADTGLVTCMYRGHASPTIGSRLEAVGFSTDFHPGVLAARYLEGDMRFALGSTLAFSRAALQAVGGFQSIADYLADDYELGNRIAAAGLRVVLSDVVVDVRVAPYTFMDFLEHQIRWNRSTRDSRQWGYLGLCLTFAIPWAIFTLIASKGAAWSCWLFCGALLLRFAVAFAVGSGVLHDRQLLRYGWLIPVRDMIGALVWLFSFTGRSVSWRGDEFVLRDGKLYPADTR